MIIKNRLRYDIIIIKVSCILFVGKNWIVIDINLEKIY